MIWIILIIAVIVLLVLKAMGVFRKEANCRHCNKTLKGTEQNIVGAEAFILCRDCYDKIHPLLRDSLFDWKYTTYLDYLAWDEETKEERKMFTPSVEYGSSIIMKVDPERMMFSLEKLFDKNPLVLMFSDLLDANFDISDPQIKETVFGTKVEGNEFFSVTLERPKVKINGELCFGVKCKAKLTNFLKKEYQYYYSDGFARLIETFAACIDTTVNMQNHQTEPSVEDNELQKALNLYMFDSIEDVTTENLKKQRNALIKAFHPDNDEENESYSQKINAAYEILKKNN